MGELVERLGRDFWYLSLREMPVYKGVLRDFLRDGEIFYQTFENHILNAISTVSQRSKNVPSKRLIYSQLGNISFPTWEHFIPNLGIITNTIL